VSLPIRAYSVNGPLLAADRSIITYDDFSTFFLDDMINAVLQSHAAIFRYRPELQFTFSMPPTICPLDLMSTLSVKKLKSAHSAPVHPRHNLASIGT